MPPLIGYADRFSVRAGGSVAVKVSTSHAEYHADLVRIRSADANPAGPGIRLEAVASSFAGAYSGRQQAIHNGSWGEIACAGFAPDGDWTFALRVQPWLLDGRAQVVLGWQGVRLSVTAEGAVLRVGAAECRVDAPMLERRWYELRLVASGGAVRLVQRKLHTDWGSAGDGTAELAATLPPPQHFILAADGSASPCRDHFNGRIEHPMLLRGAFTGDTALEPAQLPRTALHAWWDFSLDMASDRITDHGPHRWHGRLVNLPTRALRGAFWTGDELRWRDAPGQYAAVHFHADDLYDAGWQTDFSVPVPADLPSGVYGVRLRAGKDEDIVPFFVLPPAGTATARVALLFPTYTYQVYANYDRGNFNAEYRARRADWGSYPHHPAEHKQFGLSTYDWHADGSGVALSSMRRPILTFRPGQIAYPEARGSGLRHFPADMHLAAWLDAMGIAWDAITDHDLEEEGVGLLARYRCVLTGSHPEYHSLGTLDALRDYTAEGGRLVYLGGNGFYWRVATSPDIPDVLELRRTESGTRAWAAETGEYYHQFDGGYGGLWRRQDRAPQKLAGVGFSAQGRFEGSFYRRLPASYAPEVAWIFDGVQGEVIGDFGFSGGGAAGFELDRADPLLGTPPNTVVLCRSEGHQAHFGVTPEDVLQPRENQMTNAPDPLIRSDMVYFETARGGAVFSVGSITFCGSLPWNGFDNQVSTMIRNVVLRFSR
ncbi:MAG: N,N-dimethylformamidase large subunit [Acetobacteraceae bacterium]|nr:N,N-dimethylformamidase large subunit [Acetobacteraceae bacterium]